MDIRWHVKQLMAKMAIHLLKGTGWYSGYWNHWRGTLFDHAEQHGLHITPVHYYTPIPAVGTYQMLYGMIMVIRQVWIFTLNMA